MAESGHLQEQDIALFVNGELEGGRKGGLMTHLESCWECRERIRAAEHAIGVFIRERSEVLNGSIPSAAGPEALLRARMAADSGSRISWKPRGFWAATGAFAAVLVAVLVLFQVNVNAEGPRPHSGLTPGETRPVSLEQVCAREGALTVSADIPQGVRTAVFAAYGIRAERQDQYEVDYLITPDLGGADTIRNLWPQPYSAKWNAHVKDRLEQRLHELVCRGQVDLATAQRDIAADWIGAYRKYVGTEAR